MDQLSRDAKAARKLGISYGKYKGLQWERVQAALEEQRREAAEKKRQKAEREAAIAQAKLDAAKIRAEKVREEAAAKAREEAAARDQAEAAAPKKKGRERPKMNCCRWCGKEFPYEGHKVFCNAKCRHAQQMFNQRKYQHKKAGKEPPKKEEFWEELGQ